MFTILGTDGKEYGPVATAKVQEWMIAGRANLQTKARRADETEWRTLGDFPEFAGTAAIPAAAAATTSVPAYAAAVPLAPKGTPAEIAADMIARSATIPFDPFSCITRSFELWKANFLPLVAVTALIFIIQSIIGFIPFVSFANMFFLSGVFAGGLHYYYLGKMRGQPREVGDAFAGFNKAFVQLGLTNLIMMVLIFAIMTPFIIPFGAAIFKLAQADPAHIRALPPMTGALLATCFIVIIPLFYLSIAWSFAYTLAIDQGLGPWAALEVSRRVITRRWFHVLLLLICSGLLVLLGLFGFLIGILFTLPLGLGSLLYAYEDLCCPPPAS